jgi:hypothetical protein
VSPVPCFNFSWTVDTVAPVLVIANPANSSVTRNPNLTLTLQWNEPLSKLLVLQPGAVVWTTRVDGEFQVVLIAVGEGLQQASVKGVLSTLFCTIVSGSMLFVVCVCGRGGSGWQHATGPDAVPVDSGYHTAVCVARSLEFSAAVEFQSPAPLRCAEKRANGSGVVCCGPWSLECCGGCRI